MQLFIKNPAKVSNLEVDADLNLLSTFKLLNLPDPVNAQDAMTHNAHDTDTSLMKCDGSRAWAGAVAIINSSADDATVSYRGGPGSSPCGAMNLYGKDDATDPNVAVTWFVPDTAKTGWVQAMSITRGDLTVLDMETHQIKNLADPTAAQDAMTKNAHDTDNTLMKCDGSRVITGTIDMDNNVLLDPLLTSALVASENIKKDYTIAQVSTTGTTPSLKASWTFTVPAWVAAGSVIRDCVELQNDGTGSAQVRIDVNGTPGTPTGTASASYAWVYVDITVGPGDIITHYLYSSDAGTVYMRNQRLKFDSHVVAPTTQGWRA